MLNKLSKLFGLRRRRQRPHRSGTVRTGKSRLFVPRLEMLENRVVLSPVLCDDQFSFPAGIHTYKIPYCHNYGLDVPNADVTRVIIAVHGIEREAVSTYNDVLTAAQAAGADSNSLIIAPQFLNESDIVFYNLPNEYMYWNGPWRDGAQSSSTAAHPRPDKVSSFQVVDDLLTNVADSGNFPNLSTVIVSGHSAGGQFVQHFAATTQVENHLSGDLGLSMRYVTMNPGSYLYLDPKRWDPSTDTFNIDYPAGTDKYNSYPYGLDDVSATQYPYIAMLGTDTIRCQYGQRPVIYILGEADTNTPVDTSPPAMLQGANRFERGSIFFNYLQDYYGPDILDHQVRETVPGVGHDSTAMYASSAASKWLFDLNGPGRLGNPGPEQPNVATGAASALAHEESGRPGTFKAPSSVGNSGSSTERSGSEPMEQGHWLEYALVNHDESVNLGAEAGQLLRAGVDSGTQGKDTMWAVDLAFELLATNPAADPSVRQYSGRKETQSWR